MPSYLATFLRWYEEETQEDNQNNNRYISTDAALCNTLYLNSTKQKMILMYVSLAGEMYLKIAAAIADGIGNLL